MILTVMDKVRQQQGPTGTDIFIQGNPKHVNIKLAYNHAIN